MKFIVNVVAATTIEASNKIKLCQIREAEERNICCASQKNGILLFKTY
jgi:hypothetical protein